MRCSGGNFCWIFWVQQKSRKQAQGAGGGGGTQGQGQGTGGRDAAPATWGQMTYRTNDEETNEKKNKNK